MSNRIKCISCESESYNDFGKTALHCGTCYQELQARIKELEEDILAYKKNKAIATVCACCGLRFYHIDPKQNDCPFCNAKDAGE